MIIACMIALPVILIVMLIGKVPYRFYRRKFDEPVIVEFLKVFAHIGFQGILALGWKLYTAIKPKTVYENFMVGPPVFSNVTFPTAAFAFHVLEFPNVALGIIAVLLFYWMTFIPYQRGFRSAIRVFESRKLSSHSSNEDTEFPTGKSLIANAIGILICSGTLGYFAGGVVGAMQTIVVVFSILASFAAWLLGMTHAVYVYGPHGHYSGRSRAYARGHAVISEQQDPFYPDEVDEGVNIKSSDPEKPGDYQP